MANGDKIVSHKGECEMALNIGDSAININPEYIKNYVSDYKYAENDMPILWVMMDVDNDTYDRILDNQGDAQMYLRVRNYNSKESNAIHLNNINDAFTYFIPSQYNKSTEISYDIDTERGGIRHLTLGLMKEKLMEEYKTPFNAVYPETSTKDMIANILEEVGGDIVMDPIQKNTEYPSFTMPPQDSVKNALDYVFQQEPFFKSNYQFFMDFDKTYLIDSSGKQRDVSSMPSVLIDIQDMGAKESFYDGCRRDNESGSYVIYVNKTDVEFHINAATEKSTNELFGYNTGEITTADTDMVAQNQASPKAKFMNSTGEEYTSIKKTILQNTIVTMTVSKKNMDASVITPDKCYLINSPDYTQYNGKYLLDTKSEMMSKTGFDFDTTSTLTFRRISAQ